MSTTAISLRKFLSSAGLVLALAAPSEASPDPLERTAKRQPALILARALVAEAGYTPQTDHPAILHVLRRRSHRKDAVGDALLAIRYCSVFHAGVSTPQTDALRHASLEYLRLNAPDVVMLAEQWVAGVSMEDPCHGAAIHWGSPEDIARKAISVRSHVACGETLNIFLRSWH